MSEPGAATEPLHSEAVKALSADDRAHWQLTGELPSSSDDISVTDAASSPAEPAEQATSTEATTPAASEPATSTTPPGKAKRPNAETRKAELAAEIHTLLQQRDSLKAEVSAPRQTTALDVVPASSPAPVTMAETVLRPDVTQSALSETQFFERFPDAAYGDFTRYTARYEFALAKAEDAQAQHVQARRQAVDQKAATFTERLDAAKAADPTFRVDDRLMELTPVELLPDGARYGPGNVIASEVLASDAAPALLRYFTDHWDALKAIATLDSDVAIARAIGRLEATLESRALMPSQPTVKTVTSAPAPAQTLGSKPSAPVDVVEAAIGRKDFASYREAMNRREVAS